MKRVFVLTFVLLLTLLLAFPQSLLAESAQRGEPNSATASHKGGNNDEEEIEIVKKVAPVGWPKSVPSRGGRPIAAKGILGEPLPEGGNRYAVVVGISDYPGTEYDIHYADDDAILMASVLNTSYGFNDVRLLVDGEATRSAILGAIEEMRGLESEDDEVVFFFSGHGVRLTPARGQAQVGIVTWGAEEPMPYPEFIWDKELKAAFRGFETDRIILIFDCCLAGGMIDLTNKGRVICMASTQNGYAAEYGEAYGPPIPGIGPVNHGMFTYFFAVLGMQYGFADIYDHDGNPETLDVTIEEAFDFARANLQGMSLAFPELWQIPTIGDNFPRDLLP